MLGAQEAKLRPPALLLHYVFLGVPYHLFRL